MTRSRWKGPFLDKKFLKKTKASSNSIVVWSRRSVIPASLVGKRVHIYNGKIFKKLVIKSDFVGFKFGEFATTRQKKKILKKKQIKKK